MDEDTNLSLNIFVLGPSLENLHEIKISLDQTVQALKKVICDQSPLMEEYEVAKSIMWKPKEPVPDISEDLSQRSTNILQWADSVDSGKTLDLVFTTTPIEGRIHLVALIPSWFHLYNFTSTRPKRPASRSVDNPEQRRQAIRTNHEAAINAGKDAMSPSSAAKPDNLDEEQKLHPVAFGRPIDQVGPSIYLYHSVFWEFYSKRLERGEELPSYFRVEVYKLFVAAAEMYRSERDRGKAIKKHLNALFGEGILQIKLDDNSSSIECILTRNGIYLALRLLVELKNEIGTGGCDPSVQGSYSTRKYWVDDDCDMFRNVACCPTFILSIAGPWLLIQGFILADFAVVQPLTDRIWLGGGPNMGAQVETVANIFFALKKALQSLDHYYSTLPKSPPINDSHLFPYITSYTDENRSTQSFTYIDRLFAGGGRAVFSARDGDNRELVVKFTTRYNIEAHQLLANAGLAPTLYYAGEVNAPGFMMIVMKRIGQENAALLVHSGKRVLTPENCTRVSRAIELLHQSQYVFGDLRLDNILVGDDEKAYLADFDWCGLHGIDRYPVTLNDTGQITWAEGVGRDKVMKKDHDLEMLRLLLESQP